MLLHLKVTISVKNKCQFSYIIAVNSQINIPGMSYIINLGNKFHMSSIVYVLVCGRYEHGDGHGQNI